MRGFLRAEVQFGKEVGEELAAAFVKRLRNSVPATAEAARWAVEEFVVLISAKKADAVALGKWISENLSGPYVCLKGGTAIRPAVQATVGIVDTQPKETADHVLRRIEVFFGR